MESYYTNLSNERDPTPVLSLMEHLPGNNMMYIDPGSFSGVLAGNFHQQLDISSVGNFDSAAHQQVILSGIAGPSNGEQGFTGWRDSRNDMLVVQQDGAQNLQGQGLSLTLATHIPSRLILPSRESASRNDDEQSRNIEFVPNGYFQANTQQNFGQVNQAVDEASTMPRTIPHSRYLKAAQQLLDEAVNVRKALKHPENKQENSKNAWETQSKGTKEGDEEPKDEEPKDNQKSSKSEFSHGERQELQNKLTKLMCVLDEVDKRYKQYYYQMQIVVSSFDSMAGTGAAKPYTAVALQTISCHFRCLRDAITSQIQATRRNLGEEDATWNGKGVGITRLRYMDRQIRQQRALQQLGMIQQHAWRPQRGLPENSVTILRAWLFEHFLHPYPKDLDKVMLARQTGLTRSQVSNWFINARVRLWKPMVEEIYKEETGDAEMDSNSSSENAAKGGSNVGEMKTSDDRPEEFQHTSAASESYCPAQFIDPSYNQLHNADIESNSGGTDYFSRNHEDEDSCNLFLETMVQSNVSNDRFMTTYHMPELARFEGSGGVSLTLGLQHFEDGTPQMPGGTTSDGYVTMRGEGMYNPATSQAPEFEVIGIGNQQDRLVSGHMLHDFVA